MLNVINQFVYRPDATFSPMGFTPAELGLAYEEVTVQTADGVNLTGYFFPAPEATHALLYCHGNAGDIRDYRGYGRSEGQPTEEGLFLDGEAMWRWLENRAERDVLPASILGKSLGSAVGIHLAAEQRPVSLILDSAFTSMREVVALHASFVPSSVIPKLYESLERAPQIACPTLLLHGGRDMLVPPEQGRRLFETIQASKAMKVLPEAGHNDISGFDEYYQAIMEFLADPASL